MSAKAPMTSLMASHNEGHLIGDRLRELAFCDDLVIVDVASTDDTRVVAEAHGARVVSIPYSVIGENVRASVAHESRHDFVVASDPDEEIPAALAEQIARLPASLDADVSLVIVPTIYYFAGKPLRGTIWGGVSKKPLVVRRSGIDFVPAVHRGYHLRPGFRQFEITYDGTNAIRHHWVGGYREFITKHFHYVRIEGRARALTGEITGYRALARTPYRAFVVSFVTQKGHLDGFRGFALSVLYALYRTGSEISLIRALRHAAPPE